MKILQRFLQVASGRNDIVLAVLLIAIIFMMIIPLPPVVMDMLQALNLTISAILLMVAVYIKSPLAFVSFPSLLLLTTLFRLSLGIASTRLILLEANAGDIITTFGNFVVAGNLVVGAVIFLIITIVQFIVITKGSERVAEVAARFSLDAMPGKQMSIDGDMRAGTIDMNEARRRRGMVEKESQLYGAMDGAMKFVKGDAIAGLIGIAVNLLGGIAIGAGQLGMSVSDAVNTYSILTIGDGLVGQIPGLFTSITAGFIVTRVSSEEAGTNLGDEIGGEVTAQPKALMVASSILVIFAVIPGFPTTIFLALAVLSGGGGYMLHRQATMPKQDGDPFSANLPAASASGGTPTVRRAGNDADDFSLTVPVMVDVGTDVQTLIRPDALNDTLAQVRRALYYDLGVPFPGINLRLNDRYNGGRYVILLNEVPCGEGHMRSGFLLARDSVENLSLLGIPNETDKPFLPLIETIWVAQEHRPALEAGSVSFMEPAQLLSYHIGHVLRRYAEEFIGIQETRFLLSRMEERFPELVKEVQRIVPLQRIAEILQRLVSEGVSVRNMRAILTALIDWGQKEKDVVLLTEHIRGALKRQICYRHSSGLNILPAYVVTPELEDTVRNAVRQTSSGSYLALDPRTTRQIIEKVQGALGGVGQQARKPVLLTAMDIRRYVKKIVEGDCPDLPVLSYQELTPEITVQPLARVSL
ncbi:type III secretion system export apparatus subunit SctV [Hyphomicrobium sp. MC1]|uniref:type III secretion system export apparatus subunit SctV n=1 Tax=Hyphomicrobium sp. (strain MC1) TaxID=717785 RepID=UPI000213F22C|nr:type III secretion system export apparatus subunit SctV [Hyphomicrobium sp. MC1]CCB66705.1 Low calcium response locus protein D [Hyphomicrobium sp. MC1]